MDLTQKLTFQYTNWKGESNYREVYPMNLYWGSTEHHPTPQWLLEAYDFRKKAVRHFAVKEITKFYK